MAPLHPQLNVSPGRTAAHVACGVPRTPADVLSTPMHMGSSIAKHCGTRRRLVCAVIASEQDAPPASPVPSLRPPPPRPAPELTRATPSPRTIAAKEKNDEKARSSSSNGMNRPSAPNREAPSDRNQASTSPSPPAGPSANAPPANRFNGRPSRAPANKRGARGRRNNDNENSRDAPGRPQRNTQTAASRRQARAQRKERRVAARLADQAVKEEIIEVGPEGMSVTDLAEYLAINKAEVVKTLFLKGVMVQVNQVLDPDAVKLVAEAFEVEVVDREEGSVEDAAKKVDDFLDEQDLDRLQPRPPVVTVMGHVDHGKTSLLDYIRNAKVAAGEAGGITQTIGAYTCSVATPEGDKAVTFLDTPGHEAFSAMRARGARVTDIAIVICAADDGVRPQTVEAIGHARAAGVPIVVAINKIDKDGANAERAKQMLSEAGLLPEEWGGDTPMVPISAKTGAGIDELLETVLLVAEVEDLSANPQRLAAGTVIEAHLDKKKGAVATLLVQAGTLRVGDPVCAGCSFGKVRALNDTAGAVKQAGPSIAVQMIGLDAVPNAGDTFRAYDDESDARAAAQDAIAEQRLQRLAEQAGGGSMVTLSSLATVDDDVEALQRINIILKADASGSVEAVKGALTALPQDSVMLRFLLAAAGDISSSDLDLASASGGLVLGFNINPSDALLAEAKRKGVEVRSYDIIYNLLDDVRAAMEGRLRSVQERVYVGTAEVKAVFGTGKQRVAGCVVTDGVIKVDAVAEVMRRKRMVSDSRISSLRRIKDNVKEVVSGTECGVAVAGFTDFEEGDVIKVYDVVEQRRSLEDGSATTVLELEEVDGLADALEEAASMQQ